MWFTGDGDGTVFLDYTSIGLYDQNGVSPRLDQGPTWNNPACLNGYPAGIPGAGQGQYNLVNHAILSLPQDLCVGFRVLVRKC